MTVAPFEYPSNWVSSAMAPEEEKAERERRAAAMEILKIVFILPPKVIKKLSSISVEATT